MEIWKSIPNADNYLVSNFGRIKSKDHWIAPARGKTHRWRMGRIFKQSTDKDGYKQICFGLNHKFPVSRKVHRLVMLAFIGPSELEVNHKDGDKSNNNLSNLEYSTHSENHIHAREVLKKLVGKSHWNYKTGKYIKS